VFGQAGLGVGEWLDISVIDLCLVSRAGRHSYSNVGNAATGLTIMRNDVATFGPGGVFPGAWSHFVNYTAYAGNGTAYSIYDGCSTINGVSNLWTAGGSDPAGNAGYIAFLAHNNGIGTSFAGRTLTVATSAAWRIWAAARREKFAHSITRSAMASPSRPPLGPRITTRFGSESRRSSAASRRCLRRRW